MTSSTNNTIKLSPISSQPKVLSSLPTQHLINQNQQEQESPSLSLSIALDHSDNNNNNNNNILPNQFLKSPWSSIFSSSSIMMLMISPQLKFSISFFLFGLLNNILYVIILSAALDLVPKDIPTGVILISDIGPCLLVKLFLPYCDCFTSSSNISQIQYNFRILICSFLSFFGILIIIFSEQVFLRLIGISLSSISSGLGEMTFLQLTSKFNKKNKNDNNNNNKNEGVSWFASGTGAAGILGASMWWLLRSSGVRLGLGLSSILPICLSIVYFFLLPKPEDILSSTKINSHQINENQRGEYSIIEANDQEEEEEEEEENDNINDDDDNNNNNNQGELSFSEKIKLTKPLLLVYMLPLFTVYFAEYTINTGIAPTLLYPPPKSETNPIFSHVFKTLKDYYPFWQLTYQTFVFFSRSSMAIFKFGVIPKKLIGIPSIIQIIIFLIILMESYQDFLLIFFGNEWIFTVIFFLISLEGICGGLAYVSAYYWLGFNPIDDQYVEFRMACVGFSDTLGILLASIFSSWLQPRLCGVQVSRGRLLCKQI